MNFRQGFQRSQFYGKTFFGGPMGGAAFGGARAFSANIHLMRLRAAQKGIYAYQMAAYTGIGAGTPGLLSSMMRER